MRKKLGLFIVVGILMNVGVASADRGLWYSSGTSWVTYFNILNTGTTSQVTTIEFFDIDGGSLGSTTTTLAANAQWNFGTDTIGTIDQSVLEAASGERGQIIISSATAGQVRGHSSIFSFSGNSGFQMRIPSKANNDLLYQ